MYYWSTMVTGGWEKGAQVLIKSIEKFHPGSVVYLFHDNVKPSFLEWTAGRRMVKVEPIDFRDPALSEFIVGLWQGRPSLLDNRWLYHHPQHECHPDFPLWKDYPGHKDGLDHVHHFHPYNLKAHSTAWAMLHGAQDGDRVIQIDCDAFLLTGVDEVYKGREQPDSVIGFDDDKLDPSARCALLGYETDVKEVRALNAGIVFYVKGPRLVEMMREFTLYCDSPHYWDLLYASSGDQGVLRHLLFKYSIHGNAPIALHVLEDATHWNPSHHRCEDMVKLEGVWCNAQTQRPQHIWHNAHGNSGPPPEGLFVRSTHNGCGPGVVAAFWEYMEGEPQAHKGLADLADTRRCMKLEEIKAIAEDISKRVEPDGEPLRILELGTYFGGSAIALAIYLRDLYGLECRIDTLDVYTNFGYYQTLPDGKLPGLERVNDYIRDFGLTDVIFPQKISVRNRIMDYVMGPYDVGFVDADHTYAAVIADLFMMTQVIAKNGLLYGDDYEHANNEESAWRALKDLGAKVEMVWGKKVWRLVAPEPRKLFHIDVQEAFV